MNNNIIESFGKDGLIAMTDGIISDVDAIQRMGGYDRSLEGLEMAIENLAGNTLALALVVKEILRRSDVK